MERVRTAVVGASGYSGEMLLRILLRHPGAEVACVTSRQHAGKTISEVFPRFRDWPGADLAFVEPDIAKIAASGAGTAFLALPHGVAVEFARPLLDAGLRVIDLSADFRMDDPETYAEFYGGKHPDPDLLGESVYGLPEVHAEAIKKARLIGSPGCYPTSMLLPLLPLLRDKLIDPTSIHVFSTSGVSGAGRTAAVPFLFSECNESVRAYSVPKHRHLCEVEQELTRVAGHKVVISFTPHLVPVTAGICTTIYAKPSFGSPSVDALAQSYETAYADAPFVRRLGSECPDTKYVVGTNFIDIGWAADSRTDRYILMSAEDNLWKGAAGQAVQSFNLIHDLDETAGLL